MSAEDDAYYAQQELYSVLDKVHELEAENQRLWERIKEYEGYYCRGCHPDESCTCGGKSPHLTDEDRRRMKL